MPGGRRLHLELPPEDADKVYVAVQKGQLADLGIVEARLCPVIANPPDDEQRFQLLILLDRVKESWVDGVLKNSLYNNEVLISLGSRPVSEKDEAPWEHLVQLPSQRRQIFLKDRSINTVFDATRLLLILGEPGSGKTTTMLDLAQSLLERARTDIQERVPIVANLSSWKMEQPLAEWIAWELSKQYQLPIRMTRSWLKSDYLVPFLDGLDEVQTALQPTAWQRSTNSSTVSNPRGS
jgi:predicted NACHT family NTPase